MSAPDAGVFTAWVVIGDVPDPEALASKVYRTT
jgi:hypothetical protein